MRFFLLVLFFLFSIVGYQPTIIHAQTSTDWYMAGANPERTGWVAPEVRAGSLLWARPIEAYIDQKTQIIAANQTLYVATARGLIALDANNGSLKWRYDTQLPIGHSPTIDTSQNPPVLYAGGLDKKLYALNANTGTLLWTYMGALAGFYTNPVVIDQKVILGNRDGNLYAINAQGNANAGQLAWKFQTQGPINFSPAVKNGLVFIASNDNYAYAINLSNGTQVWKSAKLPGDGFHSYYPVIYRDKVIFPTTHIKGQHVENEFRMTNVNGVYQPVIEGDPLASGVGGFIGDLEDIQAWSHGFATLYPWRVLEHFENNPDGDTLFHQPENRAYIVLNQVNGQEFTFDSTHARDPDTYPEYLPFSFWNDAGTNYPPVVNPYNLSNSTDDILYGLAPIACCSDVKGKLYGWNIDYPSKLIVVGSTSTTTLPQAGAWAAMAEPQAISGGGNVLFRNLCCNRVGDWFNSITPYSSGQYWSYNLSTQLPNIDDLWTISPVSISRHVGWYSGTRTTGTGVYHSHGDQAPLIPYNGKVYAHRSNVILAYGSGPTQGQLPLIPANQPVTPVSVPSDTDLRNRLNAEIQKIVDVDGHLRPGWLSANLHNYANGYSLEDYFINPGDTLLTLSYAYPYLSTSLKTQVQNYLSSELIPSFFNPTMYAQMGYDSGSSREWLDIPDELFTNFQPKNPTTNLSVWSFQYPQHNFYAMYMYAKNVPGANTSQLYTLAKSKLKVPTGLTAATETTTFTNDPFQHNAWITGYHGFLKLQELAGMQQTDATLRTNVINERNRLISLRNTLFDEETAWVDLTADYANNYKKSLDIARNFMYLSPELAADFRANSQLFQKAQSALNLYEYIAPFWFVGKYESMFGESVFQNLYEQPALFQAKAWILEAPRQELYKYLDTPMFAKGDLFYIQNLVAVIEAPVDPNSTPPPPPPIYDFIDLLGLVRTFGQNLAGNLIDIFDLNTIMSNL